MKTLAGLDSRQPRSGRGQNRKLARQAQTRAIPSASGGLLSEKSLSWATDWASLVGAAYWTARPAECSILSPRARCINFSPWFSPQVDLAMPLSATTEHLGQPLPRTSLLSWHDSGPNLNACSHALGRSIYLRLGPIQIFSHSSLHHQPSIPWDNSVCLARSSSLNHHGFQGEDRSPSG